MHYQRVRAAQGERQSFGPPVRCLQDVNLKAEVLEREVTREGPFHAKCRPRQPTADLWKPPPNSSSVQVDAVSLRVLEGLPWNTGEDVNLMPTGGEDSCHRLHVRPDTSAAGLRGILS